MVLSMDRWVGKTAIVTGASAGIGAAICKQLAESGIKVVGFARRPEVVEKNAKLLKKGSLVGYKVDITNEQVIKSGFEWVTKNIGPVHILVNNAGVLAETNLTEGDTKLWKKVLDTNILGLCICTREACTIMKENNIDGHIVHINSILGHEVQKHSMLNVYPASKFAVTALTESLRVELNLKSSKIKVTSVSPGLVRTDIFSGTEAKDAVWERNVYLSPDDIADGVVYALSTPPNVQVHELTIKPLGEIF